jgi:hypothetical protein
MRSSPRIEVILQVEHQIEVLQLEVAAAHHTSFSSKASQLLRLVVMATRKTSVVAFQNGPCASRVRARRRSRARGRGVQRRMHASVRHTLSFSLRTFGRHSHRAAVQRPRHCNARSGLCRASQAPTTAPPHPTALVPDPTSRRQHTHTQMATSCRCKWTSDA